MIAADYTNGLFPCFLKTHFQVIMMSMHYFVIKRIEMLFWKFMFLMLKR